MSGLASELDVSEFMSHVGRDVPQPEQFKYEVNRDGIRCFAYAVPDPSALYLDDAFARATRWAGIIAPPGYLYAHGSPAWLGKLTGIRAGGRELTGSDNATEAWTFLRPVRPGDIVLSNGKVAGLEIKRSRKLGAAALVNEEMRYVNQRGELVALLNSYSFRFDAEQVGNAATLARSYPNLPAGQFTRNVATPPPLPGILPTPERRYDPQRFFEDVEIGEVLPDWEHGPVMAFDMGRFNAATAGAGYDRIGKQGHIPDGFAPGVMRIPWFGAMLTRWAGPDSWVTRISQRNEEWVLVGYKVRCGGVVTGKIITGGRCLVSLDIWCDSELGFRTNSGVAEIELPSRSHPLRPR